MTAFYPLQFVAERVAGDHGAVTSLTQPGAEPHDVELTPRQVASVTDADAVVYIKGFQPAVDEAVAQSGNEHVLDTTSVVPLQTEAEEHAHDHAETPPPKTQRDEHAEEGHDHGGLDPHVWLNPLNMVTITDAVVAQLSGIDPDHAADYRANAPTLQAELTDAGRLVRGRSEDLRPARVHHQPRRLRLPGASSTASPRSASAA